tara:strand:- start:120 stop:389 length:270 start_codon:yes stop_codon:yes gene_type:complete
MAGTVVKIKQSSVAGKAPEAGDLQQGELALNTADQKLYSKDGGGTVFELTSSSTATFDMGNHNRDVILAGGDSDDTVFVTQGTYDGGGA